MTDANASQASLVSHETVDLEDIINQERPNKRRTSTIREEVAEADPGCCAPRRRFFGSITFMIVGAVLTPGIIVFMNTMYHDGSKLMTTLTWATFGLAFSIILAVVHYYRWKEKLTPKVFCVLDTLALVGVIGCLTGIAAFVGYLISSVVIANKFNGQDAWLSLLCGLMSFKGLELFVWSRIYRHQILMAAHVEDEHVPVITKLWESKYGAMEDEVPDDCLILV